AGSSLRGPRWGDVGLIRGNPQGRSRGKGAFSGSVGSSVPAFALTNVIRAWSTCAPSAILVSTSSASIGILLPWHTIGTLTRWSQVSTMDGGSLAPRNRYLASL